MSFIDRFVHRGKQLERGRVTYPPGIPQAIGDERMGLITRAKELVAGTAFPPPTFVELTTTMCRLVGTQPRGISNAFPYNLPGFSEYGYIEFSHRGLAIAPDDNGKNRSWAQRAAFLTASERVEGFGLEMSVLHGVDINYLRRLLNIEGEMTLNIPPRPEERRGEAIMPLSEQTVHRFCGDLVQRLQGLPVDYVFQPGEVIDQRSRDFLRRY